MNLEKQLKNLPEEFTIALEQAKGLQCDKTINFLLNLYNLNNEITSLNNNDKRSLIILLKHIYNYGFYGGVSFALDPVEYIKSNS